MKTTDLIEILEQLVADHKITGAEQVMGPHEIHMDLFQYRAIDDEMAVRWRYKGVTGNIGISYTDDGVFCMLGPKETWT
jgi:hypothetical protein